MAEQLSAAERGVVEQVCQDYRHWAPAAAQQPTPGTVLQGGYNNLVVMINGCPQRWVLRIRREASAGARDFSTELRNHLAAAQAGVAPTVYFSDPDRGLILMEYIDNEPVGSDNADTLEALGNLLRQIHRLPTVGAAMDSTQVLREYQDLLPDDDHANGGVADTLKRHAPAVAEALQHLKTRGARKPVLCHNDLLSANWRRKGSRLLALDWEYAAPGDRFFDLAVCSSAMSEDAANSLLACYLQRPPKEHERQQLRAQALIYRCIEACWYRIHQPASPIANHSNDRLKRYFAGGVAS